LTQILTNLLRNGLNRSKANQTVTVTVASNGPLVRIYVIDEGAAISADEHDLIFEKYFQSHNDDQRRDRRASLNLALAKVLTEAQNGVIGVTSESGRGNQFYVQFSKFELPSNEDKA
jgi:signal transduction histidine kinase